MPPLRQWLGSIRYEPYIPCTVLPRTPHGGVAMNGRFVTPAAHGDAKSQQQTRECVNLRRGGASRSDMGGIEPPFTGGERSNLHGQVEPRTLVAASSGDRMACVGLDGGPSVGTVQYYMLRPRECFYGKKRRRKRRRRGGEKAEKGEHTHTHTSNMTSFCVVWGRVV